MKHEDTTREDEQRLKGRPLKLTDLVEYQEGSVVSRTVVDRKVGTVTLFAFDKAQGLSEHTAPYDALVHVFDGEALVTIAGNEVRVQAGEMVIMPANQPHSLHATTAFKMVLVMIRS